MKHLSSHHLQKYQNILDQIDAELVKHETLKEQAETETDKLITVRIAMNENFAEERVFKVLLKVYDSIFDLFYLYGHDISREQFDRFRHYDNRKFYLIEVYVSKPFKRKLRTEKWLLNIVIRNSRTCVTRNVSFGSQKLTKSGQFLVIVPFDDSIEDSVTTVSLYKFFDSFWCRFKISTINVDISYHFTIQQALANTLHNDLIKLTSNYNPALEDQFKPVRVEYNLKYNRDSKHFFDSTIKNCYHRLSPQLFSSFRRDSDKVTVDFTVGGQSQIRIKLKAGEKVLSITCDPENLSRVKRFFIEDVQLERISVSKEWLLSLTSVRGYLAREMSVSQLNPDNFRVIYDELKKLTFDLEV